MTRRERLLEEYEDTWFALLMEEVAKKEGERLEALNEALRSDPEAAVPESLDRRCMEAIRRSFARQRRRSALRKTGKALRLAAVLMAVTVLLFTTAFAISEEFRVAALNLMLTVTEEYTQFHIVSGEGTRAQTSTPRNSSDYFENLSVGWIPEGFEACKNSYDSYVRFETPSGAWFEVDKFDGNGILNIDTEDADHVENIFIDGNTGICVRKDDYIHIAFADLAHDLYIAVVASDQLPVDTAKKIAENISVGEDEAQHPPSQACYFENAEIGWIPEGFVCSESFYNSYARFENALGEFFYVSINSGEGGALRVDTENPDSIENISINGNEGLCIVKNGEIGVITADLENCLYIEVGASLSLTVDTAKKIAENISIAS